jgi:hypothetical protein
MPVPRHPPLPRFDPERDGNPFEWLLAAARRARHQRQELDEARWAERDAERRAARRAHDGQ